MILQILPCVFGICLILLSTPLIAGEVEANSSTTSYWYGGEVHPLVVTRDGVNYRLIGKTVVETLAESEPTRSYAHADRLDSVRMVTNDRGKVVQRLSYDDYGSTRITGQNTAATDDGMASFYRFQGQEQEIFPLSKLASDDEALASWLDRLQLYHFPWRDYAAGLATFTEADPIPIENSLYAGLDANPVNLTDPTGGMIEESKYEDDDDEDSERAQVQDLLERFASNPEMRFTPKQHELLGKAYLERRNIIVMEIEWRNELLWEISKWKRNLRRAADAVEAQEVRDELEMEFHHLREWHLDVINKYKLAQQELEKFDNASLANAWKWSVLSLVLSSNDSESDDDVMTDLVQSIAISPSPAPAAVAPAAPEDSPVHLSQAEGDDEKAEYEVKVQHDQKNHGPDGDAQE